MITSRQNPRIKGVKKLWKRGEREAQDRFLIEGYRELTRALHSAIVMETLLISPELFLGSNEEALIEKWERRGATMIPCNGEVFRSVSYRDRPDGLLGVAKQHHFFLEDLPASSNPFYVVAEAIEKPGNLGTILRSADAAHVDGVLVCDRCTDVHNPNVVRSSVGTLFTVPVVEEEGEVVWSWLKKKGVAILAATPHADVLYTEVDLTGPIAIAVGTEQLGLSQKWMEGADLQVKIPMLGVADSLNVAMATTLLLFEVVRQRSGA
ncbi:MAG: 23S rRNA (uridine(2479)-2'-O)-methyltransferase [Chlamydiae bacterium]|nr:23S rRNA (uridine(2479)-2'-O)-methyltransferase [Chlamydiota bacterium]